MNKIRNPPWKKGNPSKNNAYLMWCKCCRFVTILNSTWVMANGHLMSAECLVPYFHRVSVKLNSTAIDICNGISSNHQRKQKQYENGALDLDLGDLDSWALRSMLLAEPVVLINWSLSSLPLSPEELPLLPCHPACTRGTWKSPKMMESKAMTLVRQRNSSMSDPSHSLSIGHALRRIYAA